MQFKPGWPRVLTLQAKHTHRSFPHSLSHTHTRLMIHRHMGTLSAVKSTHTNTPMQTLPCTCKHTYNIPIHQHTHTHILSTTHTHPKPSLLKPQRNTSSRSHRETRKSTVAGPSVARRDWRPERGTLCPRQAVGQGYGGQDSKAKFFTIYHTLPFHGLSTSVFNKGIHTYEHPHR